MATDKTLDALRARERRRGALAAVELLCRYGLLVEVPIEPSGRAVRGMGGGPILSVSLRSTIWDEIEKVGQT